MKALRPKYSVLDNHKLNSAFGVIMPDWKTSFKLLMQDMGFEEPKEIGVFQSRKRKTIKRT
jgi:hypothetical protein